MRILTSVEGVFNGFHTDPDNGVLHGHDYLVEAGWYFTAERFEVLDAQLKARLAIIDHRELPEWSAEKLAVWLLEKMGCDQVKVERPLLGHRVTVCKE